MFVAELFEATASPIKKTLVIMPGGFHPFHQGHMSLYNSAVKAFPGADVYIASTDDRSTRPVPFITKQQLSQYAGVPAGHFIQVKSPFQAKEITQHYDPGTTALIFVRSDKDRGEPPVPGGNKKDGTPAYLQPYDKRPAPMSQHGYIAYLPTVKFSVGKRGMTSASEIRSVWPTLNPKQQTALIQKLYPAIANDPRLLRNVVGIFSHNFMGLDEGWKSALAGAALAGATALGAPTTQAQTISTTPAAVDVAGQTLEKENLSLMQRALGVGLIGFKTFNNLKNYGPADAQAEINQELKNIISGNSNASRLAQTADRYKQRADMQQNRGSQRPFGDQGIDEEAAGVGVIANKKQAQDPRYSMSLTKDVRPGQINKSLKAFRLA
jgi:hypothetical protein